MGKRNLEKKKKSSAFFKPFCITLCSVIVGGLFLMASYLWILEPTKTPASRFQLTKEQIPAGDKTAEEERINEKISEILDVNSKYLDQLADEEYMRENNIYAKDAAKEDMITITFAGDILFDDGYAVMGTMLQNGGDISSGIAPDVIEQMKNADIMMLNNEFPYSERGTATVGKQFTFRARPSTVEYLNDLGVDIVSLANNHAYDQGEEAFLDTMTTLEEAGIVYVGAGRNLREAERPVYYIVNNIKIAIVAATQIEKSDYPDTKGATETSAGVFRCWNGEELLKIIGEAKENSDFVIAYLHWGTENEVMPDWAQEKQALEVAEAGADLIVGAHSHCLQPVDVIQGVPVIYSLGNFWFNSKEVPTGMVSATLTAEGLAELRFIPCLQKNCKTTLDQGTEKEQAIAYMQSISPNVRIDEEGYITW